LSKSEFKTLLTSEIDCADRLRELDQNYVEAIAQNITDHGLQNPVLVNQTKDGFKLIAGGHRIAAIKHLERTAIDCRIYKNLSDADALLMEIDENLIRNELNPIDRAINLNARKEIYEELYPEAKQGGDRKSKSKDQNEMLSFSDATAEKIGINKRTIERAVRICKRIDVELLRRLSRAGYTKEGELYNLTKFDPKVQEKIVHILEDEGNPAATVKAAQNCLVGNAPIQTDKFEKEFQKLIDLYERSSAATKKQFRQYLGGAI
tara:strand:+ start:2226 stop:3014 length:789 start_codon:yes stop_codon:yes gene_type:complete